ncbi:carbohydrate ABC transporter permease [Bifidobacterium aerophilum]|uniref:ABC transporter permease subunit n=1 Tax=Bifidobacterium aerophilum TaxID=1798155 RepID=A0A6N9Z362_9BIFI|nr:carbohydrate ABC transporter permease [Bifidobacterium aerophilum]NEG88916.1 ABC transporter permease subunit [Bifidobacterium aerophilum]
MAQDKSSGALDPKRRIHHSSRAFDAVNCTLLVIFTLLIAVPVWNIVVASFSASGSTGGLALVPDKFTLDNYKAVFTDNGMWNALFISVAKTAVGVVAHTLFCALFAYPMSKAYLKGRKLYSAMGIITMFFGGGMIPTFLLIKSLGLLDTFWVYIIPALFSYYDVIILMNFFRQIPESLIESAKIDGASEWRVFSSIILPLSMPGLATIGLFHGVAQWNDFMTTKLYVNNEQLYPLQMRLYNIIMQSQAASENGNMASAVLDTTTRGVRLSTIIITIVPILVLYPLVQRYFVGGTMLGAVKG